MKKNKAFFVISLLVLYSVWLPIKSISYILPLFAITVYILITSDKLALKKFIAYCVFLLGWGILHYILLPSFIWGNVILSIITYSSFAYLIIIDPNSYKLKKIYLQLVPHVKFMIILQSFVGMIQAFYGAFLMGRFDLDTGDFVEGTIHPALAAERAFSNPMFAVNMFFLMLFLIPAYKKGEKNTFFILLLAFVSLIFASVVHVLMFICVAIFISIVLIDSKKIFRKQYFKYLSILILIPAAIFFTQPKNFNLIGDYLMKIVGGELPKITVTVNSITTVPQENSYMPVLGLGPGQYTSRASLIGTGRYLGNQFDSPRSPLPFLNPGMTDPFRYNVLELWELSLQDQFGGGSTAKPYYSWLAIYTEFGLIIVIGGLIYLYKIFKKVRILRRDNEKQLYLYLFTIGSLVLLMLGFQENYWEIPQALLWGVTVLIMFYKIIKTEYKLILLKK